MALISETLALVLFGGVIIISIVIALWMGSYSNYDKGKFHVFISVVTGLGIVATFMFYYNVVILQNQQEELDTIQEISRIDDSVINSLLTEMNNASIIIPNFILSLSPLTTQYNCTGTCLESIDPNTPQAATAKYVISYRIFSLWQDILISRRSVGLNRESYAYQFLQRGNSQQLYSIWTLIKFNFASATQNFGDLIFEYALPITDQTQETYKSVADKLLDDPRYQKIINNT